MEFWDITNREDWAACESVQRGLSSPHFRPGPLAPGEDAVYQWMTLIARCYQDPVAALAQAAGKPPSTAQAAGKPPSTAQATGKPPSTAQATEKPPSTKMV